jgi:hypothetical protein
MIEPVELQDFFVTFFASAMVILFGATYAGLYAWAKLRGKPTVMGWAFASYAALAAAVFALAKATHLNGEWQLLVGLMLVGYLLAPMGIWKLCAASHGGEHG